MPILQHPNFGYIMILMKQKIIHVLMCEKIMQHKCEIHSFSIKLATEILSFKVKGQFYTF